MCINQLIILSKIMLLWNRVILFSNSWNRSENYIKQLSIFFALATISCLPPSVVLIRDRPISSETGGLWQGGLVMATHSCNIDGAFHISVVSKGNRSRSFSISTSYDLPRSWQRLKGGERECSRESYIDHALKWLLLKNITLNLNHTFSGPITQYSNTLCQTFPTQKRKDFPSK